MRGIRLAAMAVVAIAALGSPVAAHAEDFGQPDIQQAYNDGEQGVITLAYGLSGTHAGRHMSSDCNFVLLPAVNTSTVQVLIEAHAEADASDPTITPAAVGVKCDVVTVDGTQTVLAARPGAVGVASNVVTIRLAPITLCSTPSVLWSDDLYQQAAAPVCKSS